MYTVYHGLTKNGEWILFKSKTPIRNCTAASKAANVTITKFRTASLFHQIFQIFY